MKLHELAIRILLLVDTPISKVRFAKTIYFVHKALISNNLASKDDILYQRMPLGPVPYGFMTLDVDFADIVTTHKFTGLSYNSVFYSTTSKTSQEQLLSEPINDTINKTLNSLQRIDTSELVEISHRDPSWIKFSNGIVYEITNDDLKNPVPFKKSAGRLHSDDQLLQASLVKGMIEDIVSESTELEYPSVNDR